MDNGLPILIALLAFAAVVMLWLWKRSRVVIVREYESALLYVDGRFKGKLGPGRYRFWRSRFEIVLRDTRVQQFNVAGQEVLSHDNVSFKISLVVTYRIVDVERAQHAVRSYFDHLYTATQLALREKVSAWSADELFEQRESLAQSLTQAVAPQGESIGLSVESVQVRDVMLPGEVRQSFADVLRARNEGKAALERARGETAAIRSLSNAARSLEQNPALFNLRMLQSISRMSEAQNNSLVVRLGEELMGITPATGRRGRANDADQSSETQDT